MESTNDYSGLLTPTLVGQMAVKAMLYEVCSGPKPGLVDRFSSNIHADMDVFTFIDSAVALSPYFTKCFEEGIACHQLSGTAEKDFFPALKILGMGAESTMNQATSGVNTHKGLIFALGLICAAMGKHADKIERLDYWEWIDVVCEQIPSWLSPHMVDELKLMNRQDTYGGRQYAKHGALGARGQALNGYKLVRSSVKHLTNASEIHALNYNDAMLYTLLQLVIVLDDSNVMGKWGEETLKESQRRACEVLDKGHFTKMAGQRAYEDYRNWCLENHISHGGAADLLVLCIFFDKIFGVFNAKKRLHK